jgi:hypothetical protein
MTTPPNVSSTSPKSWRTLLVGTPLGWVVTLGLAALGIYLFATHTDHILMALPYLLLACPLMHLFMHGGNGHHHGRRE